jgi:hypothetical protein
LTDSGGAEDLQPLASSRLAANSRAGSADLDAIVLLAEGGAKAGMDAPQRREVVGVATARPPEAHPFYAGVFIIPN